MDLPKTPQVRISSCLAPAKTSKHGFHAVQSSVCNDEEDDDLDFNEEDWLDTMRRLLSMAMRSSTAQRAQSLVERTLTRSVQSPTEQDKLRFLYAFSCYGQSIWEQVKYFRRQGHRLVLVCYEADGSVIFDSSVEQEKNGMFWQVVHQDENGRYNYAHVALRTPQPFTFDETKPSLEDYRLQTRVHVPLYGIMSSPHKDFIGFHDVGMFGPQDVLDGSSFLTNQCTHPSHTQLIRDLIVMKKDKVMEMEMESSIIMSSCEEPHKHLPSPIYHVCAVLPEEGVSNSLMSLLFIRLTLEPVGR